MSLGGYIYSRSILVDLLFKGLAFDKLATLRLAALVFRIKIECTDGL